MTVVMDDEFAAFIARCYEVDSAGARKVRRAVISRPKGRAKSELGAMLACAEAIGPVRFSHFAKRGEVSDWGYAYQAGEPVGVPVRRPEVLCFATEKGQAGNTYDNVTVMLSHAAEVDARLFSEVDVGSTRTLIGRSGEIRPSTSGAASKDGGKETFAVADEIHLYVLPEHKQMLKTVRRNLRKRKAAQPWLMQTTTMYRPGENSAAEARHELARRLVSA
jgi:phage terminase large subunit-like protein